MANENKYMESVTEREALKLEEDIRKLGVPYSSAEPGPLYWANFRVRVMERIEEKEKAGLFSKAGRWFAEHRWQSGIAISAAALLLAGVLVHPFSNGEIPSSVAVHAPIASAVTPSQSATVTPNAIMPNTVTSSVGTHSEIAHPFEVSSLASNEAQSSKHEHSKLDRSKSEPSSEELALAAEPVSDVSDHGVSLDELSQPELEAVLQNLQSNE